MMEEPKLQLPDFLIAELYKNCLVEIGDKQVLQADNIPVAEPTLEKFPARQIDYIGKNKRNILVVVSDTTSAILQEASLHFLTNILKACKLSLDDIAIVNRAHQAFHFNELMVQFQPARILLFDTDPLLLQINDQIPEFTVYPFLQISGMRAPSLSVMNNDEPEGKLLKTRLWLCLQQLFGLLK